MSGLYSCRLSRSKYGSWNKGHGIDYRRFDNNVVDFGRRCWERWMSDGVINFIQVGSRKDIRKASA